MSSSEQVPFFYLSFCVHHLQLEVQESYNPLLVPSGLYGYLASLSYMRKTAPGPGAHNRSSAAQKRKLKLNVKLRDSTYVCMHIMYVFTKALLLLQL